MEVSKGKKLFYKNLLVIALPIMVQALITSSVNLMDSLMIGRLGDEAVAALGIGNQYYLLYHLLIAGGFTGGGVLISQFWGSKNTNGIKKVLSIQILVGISLAFIFTLGILFFVKPFVLLFNKEADVVELGVIYLSTVIWGYLPYAISSAYGLSSRAIGKTVLPMVASIVALVVNIILNYGLIFGKLGLPELGVQGAAIATVIARTLEMIIVIAVIYTKDTIMAVPLTKLFDYPKSFFKMTMEPIMHVIYNDICWGLGFIIYTAIYGRLGTESLASIQIINTIQSMFMIAVLAVSSASCVMIGNQIGSGAKEQAKVDSVQFMKITFWVSLGIGILIAVGAPFILNFYKVSSGVIIQTRYLIWIAGATMPVRGLGILMIVGILRGGGDASGALRIELVSMWLIGVPICFIGVTVLHLPVYLVYLLVTIEEWVKLGASLLRFRSGKWTRSYIDRARESLV